MDKAREKTDKLLSNMERRINKVYAESPALRRISKKYEVYMKSVSKELNKSYLAYANEVNQEKKNELKKAYSDQVKELTVKSKTYRNLIDEFTSVLAEVNQQALDLVNADMPEIYKTNYNQVAVDCRKVGIEVNG